MSARSSRVSGCSTSGSASRGSTTRGDASPTSGAAGSGSSDSKPRVTPMFETPTLGGGESMWSPEGSPARAPAPPASAPGSTIPRPFCGARWPQPFATFDRDTCSWRTWRTSLLSTTEPSGERFSGNWPRSGSMSGGTAFQQQPSAPRTSVTGSLPLLPTPTASDGNKDSKRYGKGNLKLSGAVETLLPTPRATDGHQGPGSRRSSDEWRPALGEAINLLPTPVEGDSTNSRSATAPRRAGSKFEPGTTLSDVAFEWSGGTTVQRSGGGKPSTGLRLSPWFVEWMIGAPAGWSDPACPLSATEFRSRLGISPAPSSGSSRPSA